MFGKKMKLNGTRIFAIILVAIIVGYSFYENFYTPKNSLELYQDITFADSINEVQKLFEDGYEVNFTEDVLQFMRDQSANRIGQFTLFEYNAKSYIVMTSPGTKKLKVLAIEELPKEIRDFFSKL